MGLETFPYDAADVLKDDATISAYLNLSLEDDDAAYFIRALGAVARARNRIPELASQFGMPVVVLERCLREGKLEMDIVLLIARALGIRLSATLQMETLPEEAPVLG